MSTARSDLLLYIGVALATVTGLFVLHFWYGSFLDVRFNSSLADRGPSEALLAAREEEQKALGSGKVPLAQAMSVIGRASGRGGPGGQGRPASLKPAASEDLSAVSGWIHQRGFKPQTAFPVRTAKKPAVAAAAAAAAPAAPAAEPAPAPAAEPAAPAAKPRVRQLKLKTEMVRPARPQIAR